MTRIMWWEQDCPRWPLCRYSVAVVLWLFILVLLVYWSWVRNNEKQGYINHYHKWINDNPSLSSHSYPPSSLFLSRKTQLLTKLVRPSGITTLAIVLQTLWLTTESVQILPPAGPEFCKAESQHLPTLPECLIMAAAGKGKEMGCKTGCWELHEIYWVPSLDAWYKYTNLLQPA